MDYKKNYLLQTCLLFAILYGFYLILIQLLQDRGVWGDEAFLTENILLGSYKDYWFPLRNNQVAPVLFLSIEKLIVSILGNKDISFRIFPFFTAIGSTVIFFQATQKYFSNYLFSLLALSLLLLSPSFIYYSSEIKPYILEFFFTIVFLYFLCVRKTIDISLLLIGCLGIFMANSSMILLFCISLKIIYDYIFIIESRSNAALLCISSWGFSVVVVYIFFVHNNTASSAMDHWWSLHEGFLFKDFTKSPLLFFYKSWEIFASSNGFIYDNFYPKLRSFIIDKDVVVNSFSTIVDSLPIGKVLFSSLYVVGVYNIIKTKNTLLFFVCILPIATHICLNLFQLYPIAKRINLYQFPLVIFTILYGLKYLLHTFSQYKQVIYAVTIFALVLITFNLRNKFPISHDNTKEALTYLLTLKKESKNIKLMLPLSPTIKHYSIQKPYNELIIASQTYPMRQNMEKIDGLTKEHWIYIAPEHKELGIKQLKNKWSISEEIPHLNLYKVVK